MHPQMTQMTQMKNVSGAWIATVRPRKSGLPVAFHADFLSYLCHLGHLRINLVS